VAGVLKLFVGNRKMFKKFKVGKKLLLFIPILFFLEELFSF